MRFLCAIGDFFRLYMPEPLTRRLFFALWIVFALQAFFPLVTGLLVQWPPAVAGGQVWRLLTHGLLHASIGHILFNSLVLFFFGGLVEGRLGAWRTGWLIVLAVLAGGLAHQIGFWGKPVAALGFSAACYALMVAVLFIAPDARVWLYGLFPIPVKVLVPAMILLEVLYLVDNVSSQTSHWGHLAGAFAGLAMMLFPRAFAWLPGMRRGRRIVDIKGGRGGGGGRLSMGHPGRSENASDLYDDPHWKLDQ